MLQYMKILSIWNVLDKVRQIDLKFFIAEHSLTLSQYTWQNTMSVGFDLWLFISWSKWNYNIMMHKFALATFLRHTYLILLDSVSCVVEFSPAKEVSQIEMFYYLKWWRFRIFLTASLGVLPTFRLDVLALIKAMKLSRETSIYSYAKACGCAPLLITHVGACALALKSTVYLGGCSPCGIYL